MKFGTSSFRRILLSRLLLLSVPVLLMGVYVTYRKARSAFLETARQNLTESAVRKGESISHAIESLQANLITASDSVVLKLGSRSDHQAFLEQLALKLPTPIQCVQLSDLQAGKLLASTCGNQPVSSLASSLWSTEQKQLLTNPDKIYIQLQLPKTQEKLPRNSNQSQLELLLAAPVYNLRGQLRYALSIQAALLEKERIQAGSLQGYPVVINEEGIILAHPFPERVGRNIKQEEDAARLENLIRKAIEGKSDFLHLFALEKDGVELVAGYSAISSPVTGEERQKWIVLAITPLNAALAPLREIQTVLLSMMLALICASVLATLYISWELARPVEQIRDYALSTENEPNAARIPNNFGIREFNQLATALEEMVQRLKTWGEEIMAAWQEAQTANQLKSEFLATTSHELRTPLNGIINCVRIVRENYCDNPEEEKEFLQQADDAAMHLLGIINDILDLSKIEAGKLSVTLEPVNLPQLLSEVVDLQTATIKKKELKLTTDIWTEEIIVNADPAKLKQVLLNILGNAIKFTESGEITLGMRLELDEMYQVVIIVKDTGIGIDPKQQDKLFRPFVMVDGSSTRKHGGTGLGLAISHNLIQLMRGNITLSSPGLGKGTTVEVSLPLAGKNKLRVKS